MKGFNFITADEPKKSGKVMVLYGAGGTLKTSTLAQFPNVVIGQEGNRGGARELVAKGARVMNLNTLTELNRFADLCVQSAGEIGAIGLDDFDFMVSRAISANKAGGQAAAVFEGKRANGFAAYTDAYALAMPALQKVMALRHQGIHIIVTCGAKKGEELTLECKTREVWQPDLPTAMRDYLVRMADLVVYTATTDKGVMGLTRESANDKRRIVAKATIGLELPQLVGMTMSGSPLVAAIVGKKQVLSAKC